MPDARVATYSSGRAWRDFGPFIGRSHDPSATLRTSLYPRSESWRPGRQKPGGQLVRNNSMRVMRKPYKTPKHREDGSNSLKKEHLGIIVAGVLSGSKTRKWVYLETI